jgi:hypothetical protein
VGDSSVVDARVLASFDSVSGVAELAQFPLDDSARVDALPWSGGDRAKTLEELRKVQRVVRVTGDLPSARLLVERGYDSAFAIARLSPEQLAAALDPQSTAAAGRPHALASISPLRATRAVRSASANDAVVRNAQANAARVAVRSVHLWANLQSTARSTFSRSMRANSVRLTEIDAMVQKLPTYRDLFPGSLDYCDCEECKSIFGAAAFLVDLLRISHEKVDLANPAIPAALKLGGRRPDLAQLPLTCENTNGLVPYLAIVNAVLGAQLRQLLGKPAAWPIEPELARRAYPFVLPVDLPLLTVRVSLAQQSTALADVYARFGAAAPAVANERLGFSPELAAIVATAAPQSFGPADENTLAALYGLGAGQLQTLRSTAVFALQTGLGPAAVSSLFTLGLGAAELAPAAALNARFYIVAGSGKAVAINDDGTFSAAFDDRAMHRTHRFLRTAAVLGWSYADLDWALQTIGGTDALVDGLPALAWLKAAVDRFGLPLTTVASWIGPVKTTGRGDGAISNAPFDTIFNAPDMLAGGAPYRPADGADPNGNPLFKDQAVAFDFGRLGPALGLRDDDVRALAAAFYPAGTLATVTTMSALYRHATLAGALGLSIGAYVVLVRLLAVPAAPPAQQIDALVHVADLLNATGTTPFVADWFVSASSPDAAGAAYRGSSDDRARLSTFLTALRATVKLPAVVPPGDAGPVSAPLFAAAFGALAQAGMLTPSGVLVRPLSAIGQAQIKPALDALNAQVGAALAAAKTAGTPVTAGTLAGALVNAAFAPDVLAQLVANKNVDDKGAVLQTAADLSAQAPAILAGVLTTLSARQSARRHDVLTQIASFLGIDPAVVTSLADLAARAAALPAGAVDFVDAILGGALATAAPYADAMLQSLARWAPVVQAVPLRPATLALVAANPGLAAIGANGLPAGLGSLTELILIARLERSFGTGVDPLLASLATTGNAGLAAASPALAALAGWNADALSALVTALYPPSGSVAPPPPDPAADTTEVRHLVRLASCFALAAKLGVSTALLAQIAASSAWRADTNWDQYSALADAFRTALGGRYTADAWAAIDAKVTQALDERERDALVALVLWLCSQQPAGSVLASLGDARALSEYLLIDVEMSGCASISKIVQAAGSVQEYLQRCRLGLEPAVSTFDVPEIWWEWILDYRVWEANRRVFLYPENYLDPTIRPSRTQLFRTLQNDLMQSQATDAAVSTAYQRYVKAFAQLARLVYVDAYNCTVHDPVYGDTETTFFFARTNTEPYTYYVCSRDEDGGIWHEWQKIDIPINAAVATPVYAFNRLFLFWAEFKKQRDSTIQPSDPGGGGAGQIPQTQNNDVSRATISYTFVDEAGNWVQPQTLASQDVVHFRSWRAADNTLVDDPAFSDAFDMSESYWHKVYVVNVPLSGVSALGMGVGATTPAPRKGAEEKLVIAYGPMVTPVVAPALPAAGSGSFGDDAGVRDFHLDLYATAGTVARANAEATPAYYSVIPPRTVNVRLADDSLVAPYELLTYAQAPRAWGGVIFRPEIDRTAGRLSIVPDDSVLHANHFGDFVPQWASARPPSAVDATALTAAGIAPAAAASYIPPLKTYNFIDGSGNVVFATLQGVHDPTILQAFLGGAPAADAIAVMKTLFRGLGDPVVFGAVSATTARTTTVKNRPNRFILDNGDETVLVLTAGTAAPIDEALSANAPPVTPTSFIGKSDTADASNAVYQQLLGANIIDANGNLITAMSDVALGNAAPLLQTVRYLNRVRNRPIVQPRLLERAGLSDQQIKDAWAALTTYTIVDENGRVNVPFVQSGTNLKLLLANANLTDKQLARVQATLTGAPAPVTLAYTAAVADKSIISSTQLTFSTVRLTTSAIDRLTRTLFTEGLAGFLSLDSQLAPVQPQLPFDRLAPSPAVTQPAAIDAAQVDFDGPYGLYYWEIFFHIPWTVAARLASNGQFTDALRWLRYIFDPTSRETFLSATSFSAATTDISAVDSQAIYTALTTVKPSNLAHPIIGAEGRVVADFTPSTDLSFLKTAGSQPLTVHQTREVRALLTNFHLAIPASHFWNFRPFRDQQLKTLRDVLCDSAAIRRWNADPFDPHAIAAMRIGAYEKAIVMGYVGQLCDWGDTLFATDTWESVQQATLLYMYAYDLLGPRPVDLGPLPTPAPKTFAQILTDNPSGVPQFLIDIEQQAACPSNGSVSIDVDPAGLPFNDLGTYFCVPENDQLIACWDRVEDRLSKIRHCLDLQGNFHPPALFAPPLDPMALVRATAAGTGIAGVVGAGATLLGYRFSVLIDRARALAGQVGSLGDALLGALEKNDAETLELLRQTQAEALLSLQQTIQEQAVEEARNALLSRQTARAGAQARSDHYAGLVKAGWNASEIAYLELMSLSTVFRGIAGVLNAASSIGFAAPNVGSPFAMTYGGQQIGNMLSGGGAVFSLLSDLTSFGASVSQTVGDHDRRLDDWSFQHEQAVSEGTGLDADIAAAQIALENAQRQLALHRADMANQAAVEQFLRRKFTNADLYAWLSARLSAIYFQSYNAALELAAAAQAALQFELNSEQRFLDAQSWDAGQRGLLAGQGLVFALDQLEAAYLRGNTRSFEVERTISLLQTQPSQLVALQTTGTCTIVLDEALFDWDFPGQYARQIKSVSVSIPAVVGPYQNVNATLRQTSNFVLTKPDPQGAAFLLGAMQGTQPLSVRSSWAPNQAIAISRGVDDSGLFQLDFRDERYLPFEGTGAVSTWTLSIPQDTNRFALSSLTDVLLHVRYTAYYDGALESAVRTQLAAKRVGRAVYVDVTRAFSAAWMAFVQTPVPAGAGAAATFTFTLDPALFGNPVAATLKTVAFQVSAPSSLDGNALTLTVGAAKAAPVALSGGIGTTGQLGIASPGFSGPSALWSVAFDVAALRSAGLVGDDGRPQLSGLSFIASYDAQLFKKP